MTHRFPSVKTIAWLTSAQMVEVDRAMIEDFHVELMQMMENAGRVLARVARERFLGGNPSGKQVIVLAGPDGNGGGALACARRLSNWGARVSVFLAAPASDFTPVPAHQLDILGRIGIEVNDAGALASSATAALVVDGVTGYSLRGAPRGGRRPR